MLRALISADTGRVYAAGDLERGEKGAASAVVVAAVSLAIDAALGCGPPGKEQKVKSFFLDLVNPGAEVRRVVKTIEKARGVLFQNTAAGDGHDGRPQEYFDLSAGWKRGMGSETIGEYLKRVRQTGKKPFDFSAPLPQEIYCYWQNLATGIAHIIQDYELGLFVLNAPEWVEKDTAGFVTGLCETAEKTGASILVIFGGFGFLSVLEWLLEAKIVVEGGMLRGISVWPVKGTVK